MECIYRVTAMDVDEISEELFQKKLEAKREIHPNVSESTFRSLYYPHGNFDVDGFDSSFHEDLDVAKEFVVNNTCDINEAGSYPYAVISKIELNCCYFNSFQNPKEDFWVYKYNHETKKYEPVDKEDKAYDAIIFHLWGYISLSS